MGLEEMEAYARQALLIDKLERKNEALHNEIASLNNQCLTKEFVKSWFAYIRLDFISIDSEAKLSIVELLGEK